MIFYCNERVYITEVYIDTILFLFWKDNHPCVSGTDFLGGCGGVRTPPEIFRTPPEVFSTPSKGFCTPLIVSKFTIIYTI